MWVSPRLRAIFGFRAPPERLARAQWGNAHQSSIVFASVIGPEFDLARLPVTARLLAAVEDDQSAVASAASHAAFLIPVESQAVLARAADYGHSREVRGDHHRSDVEVSHALGNAIGIMLLNNMALQPQIEAAKNELQAVHIGTQTKISLLETR